MRLADQSILVCEKVRSAVTDLAISGNPIGIEGASKLIEGLATPGGAVLRKLDISHINMFYHTSSQFVG